MAYIYSFSSGNGECFHGRLDLSIFAYLTKSCGKADDRSHEQARLPKRILPHLLCPVVPVTCGVLVVKKEKSGMLFSG